MDSKDIFASLKAALSSQIIGQEHLVDRLLIALLADGHLLVEGAPGLAKTRAIKALSDNLDADFHRIQFTPDLLPSDVTGTEVFRPEDGSFQFQQGPIFHNLVLADEINRAPAKVQSALLEAMAERQVSVGRVTYPLADLFLVMATQNPIEQEGTYPLPEAQLDRFLMHVCIDYPNIDAEREILQLVRAEARGESSSADIETLAISQQQVLDARQQVLDIHMSNAIEEYIIQLIMATRQPGAYHESLANWLEYGASPRATIALDRCARAHAWLQGKDFVSPDDVQAVFHDVILHRIIVSFEAEASGRSKDDIINTLLDCVPAP
ncbi:MoxR-like ATPase in aerotolerance operon [gamma proteobacterium IMCC2047]|nr:MoxR-like ATPase in aerotolerance operon [gamma proteobacterium IMCC2047]